MKSDHPCNEGDKCVGNRLGRIKDVLNVLRRLRLNCPIIQIDNVASYTYAHTPIRFGYKAINQEDDGNFPFKEDPQRRSPFSGRFIRMAEAAVIHHDGEESLGLRGDGKDIPGLLKPAFPRSLLWCRPPNPSGREPLMHAPEAFFVVTELPGGFLIQRIFELRGVLVNFSRVCVFTTDDHRVKRVFFFYEEGFAKAPKTQRAHTVEPKTEDEMIPVKDNLSWLTTICFAIGFMNCKNVKRIESRESFPSSEMQRSRGESAFLKTYKLQIDGEQTKYEYDGPVGASEEQRRLHICRGRFATYTEERPMFGRLAGTFWVPAHVRGSAKRGLVDKVYKVSADE